MTLRDYLTQWLDVYAVPFRRPNTIACYRRAIASLSPTIMEKDLSELSGLDVQREINCLASSHSRAAQLTFDMLRVSLRRAKDLRLLDHDIMSACIRPKHNPKVAQILSVQQLTEYIAAARSSPCYPLLLIIACFGLRRSEALAISWSDLDLNSGVLHIRQQRLRVAGVMRMCPLKTAASARDIPIPPDVAADLAAWRSAQRVHTFDLILSISPETLTKHHNAVLSRAGLPHVTLHGLRHSMATAAVTTACPIKVLQSILGHSSYKLTADLYAAHMSTSISAPYITRLTSTIHPSCEVV